MGKVLGVEPGIINQAVEVKLTSKTVDEDHIAPWHVALNTQNIPPTIE